MNKPNYSLLESSLPMGGIKVKMDGKTVAQFPQLDFALRYCRSILAKEHDAYETIEFIEKDGTVSQIELF